MALEGFSCEAGATDLAINTSTLLANAPSPVYWLAYSSSVWATCIFPGKHVMTFVFSAFVRRPIYSKRLMRMLKLDYSHSGHLAATNPSSTKNAIY
jgi:hypothetical protein